MKPELVAVLHQLNAELDAEVVVCESTTDDLLDVMCYPWDDSAPYLLTVDLWRAADILTKRVAH